MSEFWNNKIEPGYYDLALKSGRLSDRSPQAAWHNKTFTKISNLSMRKITYWIMHVAQVPYRSILRFKKIQYVLIFLKNKSIMQQRFIGKSNLHDR